MTVLRSGAFAVSPAPDPPAVELAVHKGAFGNGPVSVAQDPPAVPLAVIQCSLIDGGFADCRLGQSSLSIGNAVPALAAPGRLQPLCGCLRLTPTILVGQKGKEETSMRTIFVIPAAILILASLATVEAEELPSPDTCLSIHEIKSTSGAGIQ